LQHWSTELAPKVYDNWGSDYTYVVTQLKQAAFDVGLAPDVIQNSTGYEMQAMR
jgi:hypothetical protein